MIPGAEARQAVALVLAIYEACKTVGLKLEDFEGPRFRRIDQLKQLMQIGNLGPDLRWLSEPVAA